MIAHLQQILWVLRVLSGLKIFPWDNFFLFKKCVSLYFSLLAFGDRKNAGQLRRIMICALVTVIYDYETDIKKIKNEEESLYFLFLADLIKPLSREALEIAEKLFRKDLSDNLSKSGLERGGLALKFYNLIIAGKWMKNYSEKEILYFGRKLQIVDDILDLKDDRTFGEKNCFLLGDEAKKRAAELQEFLKSDFWKKLKKNSWVYRYFEKRIRKNLDQIIGKSGPINGLWKISRPHTALYAFALTLAGYKMAGSLELALALVNGAAFALITSSIMAFNDFWDRESDFKRGKEFAHHNSKIVFQYWIFLSLFSSSVLIALSALSAPAAIFCLVIWVLGILYSFLREIYVVQNIIVSLCSASPILCGMIFKNCPEKNAILVFLSLFFIILSREILGDMMHKAADKGNKKTIPIATEKKYPERISLLQQIFSNIFLAESIKKTIDIIFLNGEYLKSAKIINSLIPLSLVFLLPILEVKIFLPGIFLILTANFLFFLLLDGNKRNLYAAAKFLNMGIIVLLIMLIA